MSPITTVNQVSDAIQQAKTGAAAYCTNFFPTPGKLQAWVQRLELVGEVRAGAAFFLRKDRDFWHFYFSAAAPAVLQRETSSVPELKTERLVADLVGPEAALGDSLATLESAGFRRYRRLTRLSRLSQPDQPPATPAEVSPSPVGLADPGDRPAILDLLDRSFDHYADQIPMPYEIDTAIEARQILAIKCDGALAALLFFETQGFTSTIRYWVVAEPFQSRGCGSALIRHYFAAQSAVRRFILWVTADNENALQKYRHYGYVPDGLVDHVLLNQAITT